jgi:hypothetical protein
MFSGSSNAGKHVDSTKSAATLGSSSLAAKGWGDRQGERGSANDFAHGSPLAINACGQLEKSHAIVLIVPLRTKRARTRGRNQRHFFEERLPAVGLPRHLCNFGASARPAYIREGTPSPGGVAGDPNRAAGRGRPLKGSQPRLNGPRERTTRSPGARSYRFRFIILSVESGQMTGTISASRDASADLNRYLRYGRRDCTRTFNLTRVSPPSPTRLEVTQAQLGKLPYRKPTS